MNKDLLIQNLGLTDKEAGVYLAILELGSATIQPIARQSGVKRTSIYYFIDHLIELGLVEKVQIRNRWHFKALSPDQLVFLQQKRLDELQAALPQFLSLFNVSAQKPKISYYEGPEQMKALLLEEPRCQKELLGIWSAKDVSELFKDPAYLRMINEARIKKGVHVKVIRIKETDESFTEFREDSRQNRELKFAPEGTNFNLSMSIYDTGKVAFMSSAKEGFGLMIESQEFYNLMTYFFNLFWEKVEANRQSDSSPTVATN